MKILHTADWHIGQTFHEYDRTPEHRLFLHWLRDTIRDREIDLLLVSGDIFDLSNPSAVAVKMFYTFLNETLRARPSLQIIVIAGNHDSAARLEVPKPLLESSNVHIIGMAEWQAGSMNYNKMLIPVRDSAGEIILWCMAVPFLRSGDYPVVAGSPTPYADGVAALYRDLYAHLQKQRKEGQAIIAMGHLHCLDAQLSDHDKTEREIMGGVEYIPSSIFHDDIAYTALGHIHKAQMIGDRENIRYSGSPIPMSFSEVAYTHQVMTMELHDGRISHIESLEIPLTVALLQVPAQPAPLAQVVAALMALPEAEGPMELAPYIEVRVLLDGPEPALRHQIGMALKGRYARLAKIDVRYLADAGGTEPIMAYRNLDDLKPLDICKKIYQVEYKNDMPDELLALFNQVYTEALTKES